MTMQGTNNSKKMNRQASLRYPTCIFKRHKRDPLHWSPPKYYFTSAKKITVLVHPRHEQVSLNGRETSAFFSAPKNRIGPRDFTARFQTHTSETKHSPAAIVAATRTRAVYCSWLLRTKIGHKFAVTSHLS